MNVVSKPESISNLYTSNSVDRATEYQEELLDFIRKTKPEGTGKHEAYRLNNILEKMKELYGKTNHGNMPTMSELNSALLYVSGTLHNEVNIESQDPEKQKLHDYVYNYLDKYSSQLLGVNSMYNDMLQKAFFNDEDDALEKY